MASATTLRPSSSSARDAPTALAQVREEAGESATRVLSAASLPAQSVVPDWLQENGVFVPVFLITISMVAILCGKLSVDDDGGMGRFRFYYMFTTFKISWRIVLIAGRLGFSDDVIALLSYKEPIASLLYQHRLMGLAGVVAGLYAFLVVTHLICGFFFMIGLACVYGYEYWMRSRYTEKHITYRVTEQGGRCIVATLKIWKSPPQEVTMAMEMSWASAEALGWAKHSCVVHRLSQVPLPILLRLSHGRPAPA